MEAALRRVSAFGEDQIRHPLTDEPWWDERGTCRREGAGRDLVHKVRLEIMDSVKGKELQRRAMRS